MKLIKLIYDGEPVPAGRPKFSRIHGKVVAYDPDKSRTFKKLLGYVAKHQYKGEPIEGKPLEVFINIYRSNQKHTSRKELTRREKGLSVPLKKPDTDNYIKSILDALTGIIWADDNIIQHIDARKFYSEKPRVEITVKDYEVVEWTKTQEQ